MLLLITLLLVIILLSRLTEEGTKIPSTLAIIVYAFITSYFFPGMFEISSEEFDEILYLMLPIILLPDILNISIKELKEYAKEIFYLAFVSVILSIGIATYITPYILPEYTFSIGMLIALFTMLMATDAITVSSIMSKFKLPTRLKVYAESESLFNDVTALIIYYFVALPMIQGFEVSVLDINYILLKVLIVSTLVGVVTAYFGFLAIKVLKNPFDQFVIIYLIVIVSFLVAEHFHIAGILSIVASVLTFKYLVQKDNKKESSYKKGISENSNYTSSIIDLIKRVPALTKHEFREYKKEAMFIGIFANAVVFVIIANIIDFWEVYHYIEEILAVFVITTVIRIISISSMIKVMKLPLRWAITLSLSGTKGALAIIMVHSLPDSFIYKELFTAIVIGNVLLTTFLYTFLLMFQIKFNSKEYENDLQQESGSESDSFSDFTKDVIEVLEKDQFTKAYNRAFMEDIMSKELARMQRYKLDLSFLTLKFDAKEGMDEFFMMRFGEIINAQIRTNDYFGKLQEKQFIILTANTSLSGALVLAQKVSDELSELNGEMSYFIGVTNANETDSVHDILEKLDDALSKSVANNKGIEIET